MKGAVLIIGSLFWQNGSTKTPWDNARKNWRDKNLKWEDKKVVRVPIRYGRYSSSNKFPVLLDRKQLESEYLVETNISQRDDGTSYIQSGNFRNELYTMVLSKEYDMNEDKLGLAFICPLKIDIDSIDELIDQVENLSKAEGVFSNENKFFTKEWGLISILYSSSCSASKEIRATWNEALREEGRSNRYYKRFRQGNESEAIDSDGILNINPIKYLNGGDVFNDYDFILSAVTVPKSKKQPKDRINGKYPEPQEIGRMTQLDLRRYFQNNVKNKISTCEDDEIFK